LKAVAEKHRNSSISRNSKNRDNELRRIRTASRLYEAHLYGGSADIPEEQLFNFGADSAYSIQDLVTIQKMANNSERITGYAVNLPSEAQRALYGTGEPVYGTLTDANIGAKAPSLEALRQPLIETAAVFTVEKKLDFTMSDREIAESVLLSAGLALRDSRFGISPDAMPLNLLAADNSGAEYLKTGRPVGLSVFDIETLGEVRVSLEEQGAGTALECSCEVHGNPVDWLRWLARKLEARNLQIEKGMIVSTGSLTPPLKPGKGTYRAVFGFLGSVEMDVQ